MKLTLAGNVYETPATRLYELDLGESITIKRLTGLTIADWRLGLLTWDRLDPEVLLGVVWLLKTRAGEDVHLDQLNMIPVNELTRAFDWTDDTAEMVMALNKLLGVEPVGEQAPETPQQT